MISPKKTLRKICPEEEKMQALLQDRLNSRPLERVAFAWNEPDFLVLTPFDDRPAGQWRFLPPYKCLKNRQVLDLPPGPLMAVEWIVPEGVVYGRFEDHLYLLDTRHEEVFRLDGLAADCWRATAGYGNFTAALAFLQQLYPAQSEEDLARHLKSNISHFQEWQLLQKTGQVVSDT